MPELPEVETIRRDLDQYLRGACIKNVRILRNGLIKNPEPPDFIRLVTTHCFREFTRRGKLLIIRLSGTPHGKFLTIHLGMSGQCVIGDPGPATRIIFELQDGRTLCFNDQRCFGSLRVVDEWRQLPLVRTMGPEPLDKSFGPSEFFQIIHPRTAPIKSLLLDQRVIAGIGNIYACEALFLSGISPERRSNSLTYTQVEHLLKKIRQVLRRAITCRGTSFSLYRDSRGEKGNYYSRLMVYDRTGLPCRVCRSTVRRTVVCGRGTFFCPDCQR